MFRLNCLESTASDQAVNSRLLAGGVKTVFTKPVPVTVLWKLVIYQ